MKKLLKPKTGVILIAVVLPFRPFVESGTEQLPPTEKLKLSPYAKFESAVNEITEKVFFPLGFEIISFSRVPYISQTFNCTPRYCTLDDAVFLLKPTEETNQQKEHKKEKEKGEEKAAEKDEEKEIDNDSLPELEIDLNSLD